MKDLRIHFSQYFEVAKKLHGQGEEHYLGPIRVKSGKTDTNTSVAADGGRIVLLPWGKGWCRVERFSRLSKFGWAMSNFAMMPRLNLFTYRYAGMAE